MAQTLDAELAGGVTDTWKYTPSGAKAAGDIIGFGVGTGRIVGVVTRALVASEVGSVYVKGRFRVKKTAAGYAFSQGDKVAWDVSPGVAVPGGYAAGDFELGRCAEDATAAADYVIVEINMAAGFEAAGSGSG